MKTAISMPDEIFARMAQAASERGLSRSELISTAVRAYLDDLQHDGLTAAIDAALLGHRDDSAAAATAAGRSRLAADDW